MKSARFTLYALGILVGIAIGSASASYAFMHSSDFRALATRILGNGEALPLPGGKPKVADAEEKPIFVKLLPFTVTLEKDDLSRILYTDITLRVPDAAVQAVLDRYLPQVRDRIIGVLLQSDPRLLTDPQAMSALKERVAEALVPPFDAHDTVKHTATVLFTAFVVQ